MLSKEEVDILIDACDNPRDRALISLLYESASRASEICNLRWKNVSFNNTHMIIDVKDKNGRVQHITLTTCQDYMIRWRENYPLPLSDDNFVFVTNKNKALRHASTCQILAKVSKKAGLKEAIKPNTFRHSRVVRLINEKASLTNEDVEAMLKPTCKRCNTPISSTFNYCPHCGLPQNEKTRYEIEWWLSDLLTDMTCKIVNVKTMQEIRSDLENTLTDEELEKLTRQEFDMFDEIYAVCYNIIMQSICKDWN